MKQKAGDRKTPEGIYFLKDEYEDQYLSPIYGIKAFPLDYPNLMDKRAGKDGSAIWIHGTNKVLKPMDSNGCIALENSSILKLAEYITLDSTPVVLVEELSKIDKEAIIKQEQEISLMLDQRLQSVGKGSYHEYLSFYSDEYLPEIDWWTKWMEIRKNSSGPDSGFRIERDRTGIYHYDHVFVVLFDYSLTKDTEKIVLGKRKLFLEKKARAIKLSERPIKRISDRSNAVARSSSKSRQTGLKAGTGYGNKTADSQQILPGSQTCTNNPACSGNSQPVAGSMVCQRYG